jgi:hypothetical protein
MINEMKEDQEILARAYLREKKRLELSIIKENKRRI